MYILCFRHFFQLPVRRSPPSSSRGVGGRCPDPGFRASAGYWRASALASPHHPECYSSAPGWRSHDHETTRTWTGAVTENGWMDEWILIEVNRNSFFFEDFNNCIMFARSVTDPRVELIVIMFLSLLRSADIVLCICWVQIVNRD